MAGRFGIVTGGEDEASLAADRLQVVVLSKGLDDAFLADHELDPKELARVRVILADPSFEQIRTLFANYYFLESDPTLVNPTAKGATGNVNHTRNVVANDLHLDPEVIAPIVDLEYGEHWVGQNLERLTDLSALSSDVLTHMRQKYLSDTVLDFILVALKEAIDNGTCTVSEAKEGLSRLYAFFCFAHGTMHNEVTKADIEKEGGIKEAYESLDAFMRLQVDEDLRNSAEVYGTELNGPEFLDGLQASIQKKVADELEGADPIFIERGTEERLENIVERLGDQLALEMEEASSVRNKLLTGSYKATVEKLISALTILGL